MSKAKMDRAKIRLLYMDYELRDMFLDYVNNFLTISAFSEHYNMSVPYGIHVLCLGQEIHENNVELLKQELKEIV